jgi:hypothetical protein
MDRATVSWGQPGECDMERQAGPLRKRQRYRHGWDGSSLQEQIVFGGSIFTLDAPLALGSVCCSDGKQCQSFDQGRKRGEPVTVFNL